MSECIAMLVCEFNSLCICVIIYAGNKNNLCACLLYTSRLQDRVRGRWSVKDIVDPETGEIIVPADTMITPDMAEKVEKAGIKSVLIRTVLTCRSNIGICAKCYGANMARGRSVRIGESVGIIAAQSIGEPGTQLTMRTFCLLYTSIKSFVPASLPQ